MLAEWNVELGADDPRLEIPWSSQDGGARFLDMKRQPELLLEVQEACRFPELAGFLSWANSAESPFETAKCDAWSSRQITAEEEIFGETCKFGSYVDILFSDRESREQFADNENFAQAIAKLLRHAPEMASSADFIIRRCIDHRAQSCDSYYITFYVLGFGADENQARKLWGIALKMAQHAMIQYCATRA